MTAALLGGAGGGFPWVGAATAAIGAIQDRKATKASISNIKAQAAQQVTASAQAVFDYGIQAEASQQQAALALQRQELVEKAEAESLRQSRLVGDVDVSVGETGALAAEARTRRRRFFNQEVA